MSASPSMLSMASISTALKNGWNGLTRSMTFWRTVYPFIEKYQSLTKWKESLDKDDIEAHLEIRRQEDELHVNFAPKMLDLCLQLRGIYLKMGQVCSILPTVPAAYRTELRILQDGVPPKSLDEVSKLIEESLGQPMHALFATFEPVAIGSASVGQVHRATLHDGTKVAVKRLNLTM